MHRKKLFKYEIIASFSFSLFSLAKLTEFSSSFVQVYKIYKATARHLVLKEWGRWT
ncbi:hypothetical protein LguiA_004622 [Lonicera macranthoides]